LASMFGGSVLASLSIVYRIKSRDMRRAIAMGVITGLFCFIVNFLLSLILIPRMFPEFLVYFTFSLGGAFGAFIISFLRR
jgi:hypothetical protein